MTEPHTVFPVQIETPFGLLEGILEFPKNPRGIILLAHGSGSNRNSPRIRKAAQAFLQNNFGALRFDLLTAEEKQEEAETKHFRFNVGLLIERVEIVTRWLSKFPAARGLKTGYFGASTGGSAMLAAAARHPEGISAIVSRGGRPDLVEPLLARVKTPTLFLVGTEDADVLDFHEKIFNLVGTPEKKIILIPNAGHLFEEPGTMEEVTRLAVEWFIQYF